MPPNPANAFYGGPEEFHLRVGELASGKNEIVAVVPLKAEGAPVPGAGFSPEAVPGSSAETKQHENHQPLLRESIINALRHNELMDSLL